MPTNPTHPTAAFDPTKTVFGTKAVAVITPTGLTAFNIIGKLLDFEPKVTTVSRKVPDAAGVLRADRTCTKEADEEFTFSDIEEIDAIVTQLGSMTGRVVGTCQLFIYDPDQAVSTVRECSDVFACTVVLKSGTTKFGGGDFAKASVQIISNKGAAGAVVFTPNQAVT